MKKSPIMALLLLVVVLASILGYTITRPEPAPVAAAVAAELDPILAVSPKVEKAVFPLTITDDMGRSVTFTQAPQRIISISPSATEVLFALGLGDRLVAVCDWCNYPEEAKTKDIVTSYYSGTDPELIVSKQPDLVVSDGWASIGATIDGLGLKMIVLQPKDIAGVLQNIALVGRITGSEAQAGKLIAEMQARVKEVVKNVPAEGRPYVFYEVDGTDPSRPWTAGPGSFINSLITLAGGQNIVRDSKPWAEVSLESILMAQPEIIILGDHPWVTRDQVMQRSGAWQQVSAIKAGKVYPMSNTDLTSRPGPRLIDGLEELVGLIHPE